MASLANEEKDGVHDSGAVQHGGHENVVTRTVDERDVSEELELAAAAGSVARELVLFVAARRAVAARPRTLLVVALVDLGVGVAELDGDVALLLVLEANGEHARERLDDCRLAVGDVADRAYQNEIKYDSRSKQNK